MANQKEKLFKDFPAVTTDEWMQVVTADLKGADFDKKLVWKTNEGFNVNPFYRGEDIKGLKTAESLPGEFPYVRGTKKENNWYTRQDIEVADFKAANAKALDLLGKGVNSLGFKIPSKEVSKANIVALLAGINPEAVELNFTTCNKASLELVKVLVEYYKESGANLLECYGSVNYDPFKPMLKKGRACDDWLEKAVEVVKASATLPRLRVLSVNAHSLSDGGAYIYQELGYALADANTLLKEIAEKSELSLGLVAKKIKFNFGIGSNYFMEIAKFRAARWLWAIIVDSYKPACTTDCTNKTEEGVCRCASKIYAHAQTSRYNKTVFDAHVNLLRTQTEAMSAALAGVNSITVFPFDDTYQIPDDFSERIARNQQLLLKEECHFDKVTDPSSGSYYIETLTKSIAEQAWKLFNEIDEVGYYQALKQGLVQDAVTESANNRRKAVATRRELLLGTNQYPNFTEVAGDKIKLEGCDCGCSTETGEFKSLPKSRLAEDFETLRLATEKSGKTPKVFMLTIGNLNMRLARAQFAANFFGCAGYKIIDNLGFETVKDGVEAARKVGAEIIVLCSSDDEYATLAPEAFELIKGKEQFVVAGAPKCMDDLKAIGIENFVHVRSNVLETLQGFNNILGIK